MEYKLTAAELGEFSRNLCGWVIAPAYGASLVWVAQGHGSLGRRAVTGGTIEAQYTGPGAGLQDDSSWEGHLSPERVLWESASGNSLALAERQEDGTYILGVVGSGRYRDTAPLDRLETIEGKGLTLILRSTRIMRGM